ncbi:hypothetical protein OSTOST_03380 [Ostertagia ostertagi]
MNMYTPSLVCFILLLAKGQVLGYDCNENIPKNRQQVLLEAIDLRREPIPYIANLPNLTYSCALATEAFTGISSILGLPHDGFTITSPFTTWDESLKTAVANVPYKDLWYPRATQVGCAVELQTGGNDSPYVVLKCKFNTFRDNMNYKYM